MKSVSVHNEWDPLEEIIVGRAEFAQFPQYDISFHSTFYHDYTKDELPSGKVSDIIIEETNEDIQAFIDVLTKLDITVKQPDITDQSKMFSSPNWQTNGLYNYCPRDIMLAIGNRIIETPSPVRSRYFETHAYHSILMGYHNNGCQWISAPKPKLLDSLYDLNSPDLCLQNHEPVFDAANILRLGNDLLYLVSNTGNMAGLKWLSNTLGDQYRIHPCSNIYNHTHIDTTLIPIRPGLIIANGERVNQDNLPTILKSWEVIYFNDIVDIGCSYGKYGCASEWIGLNLLMINPRLAIVDANQLPLMRQLNKIGVDTIPLKLRHARSLGGSFHCITLDVRRK